MVDEDEGDSNEGLGLKREDPPLSPADWIMFLSVELSAYRMEVSMYRTIGVAGIFAFIGWAIALAVALWVSGTEIRLDILFAFLIVSIFMAVFFGIVFFSKPLSYRETQRKIRHLEESREDIICGKLKNYENILKRCEKRCEDAGIFKCKKD